MKNYAAGKTLLIKVFVIASMLYSINCHGSSYSGDFTWYLAEGSTNGFYTWILVQNPNDSDAVVRLTYMDEDGNTKSEDVTVSAHSRFTRLVNSVSGMDGKNGVSTKVQSLNNVGIICERAMYWNVSVPSGDEGCATVQWAGGHCSTGVTSTSDAWYLAEGSTDGFETWILVQNPNDSDASVRLTYMDEGGNTKSEDVTVLSHSRFTRLVNSVSEMDGKNGVSTKVQSLNNVGIICERAMYWNVSVPSGDEGCATVQWAGGHCSTGVTSTSDIWYLAEGSTRGFYTWILVQNPNNSDALVRLTYMDEDGNTKSEDVTVYSQSRFTRLINDIPEMDEKYGVSTKVQSLNNVGIICERAMYWNVSVPCGEEGQNVQWAGGHCSTGVTSTSDIWCLAEGSTRGFYTWILIQNPNDSDASVRLTYMDEDGNTKSEDVMVYSRSRFTRLINDIPEMDEKYGVSTEVRSLNNVGIIAERSVYWDVIEGEGWADGTCSSGCTRKPKIITCLGDSVTEGYPYINTEDTYPAKLQVLFDNAYGNGTYKIVNHGVSGYRTDQILSDMQDLNWMDEDPYIVLVMSGGNDLAQEILPDLSNVTTVISQTEGEVQQIINLVKEHVNPDNSVPYVVVSTFIPNLLAGPGGTAIVNLYNNKLESDLSGMDLLITTNWDDFYDAAGGHAYSYLMSDSVHPNEAGYEIMADNWYNDILPMIFLKNFNPINFPEPSGIVYHGGRDTLFVVSDEGWLCEVTKDGELIKNEFIRHADFEGVTYNPATGLLYLAVEGEEKILEVNPDSFSVLREYTINRTFEGETVLATGGQGIEAITFVPDPGHPEGGTFFVANQNFTLDDPDDLSAIFEIYVPLISSQESAEVDILQYFSIGVVDMSGLYYNSSNTHLYVISDTENMMYEITKLGVVVNSFSLIGNDQEGITFDDENFMYIAQDSGGVIKK